MVFARKNSMTVVQRISVLAATVLMGLPLLFPALVQAESLYAEASLGTALIEDVSETAQPPAPSDECPTTILQAEALTGSLLSEPLTTDCEPNQTTVLAAGNSISGYVFEDYDGNRQYDDGESKLENWRVSLYDQEPDWTDTWKNQVATTLTSPNGYYGFGNLPPKDYWLCEIMQNGWMQTMPHYSEQGHCHVFTFYDTSEHKEFNFGNTRFATLVVTKFEDANGNRYFDNAEAALSNWETTVDGYVHTTMNNGAAVIPYLRPGSEYILNENQQAGWDMTALYCSNGTYQYEWNGLKLFPVSNELLHCFIGNKRIQTSGAGSSKPTTPATVEPVTATSSTRSITTKSPPAPQTLAVTGKEKDAVQYIAAMLLLVSLATTIRNRQSSAMPQNA